MATEAPWELSVPVGVAVAVAVDVTTVRAESGRSRTRRLLRAVTSYLFCDRTNRACFLIFFSSHTLATCVGFIAGTVFGSSQGCGV